MSAACQFCDDTGSLSKELWGLLDCAHCGIADERTKLNAWIAAGPEIDVDQIDAWLIYRAGKDAALEQAAKVCDLIGEDWDNAGIYQKLHAAEYLAKNIRALKP